MNIYGIMTHDRKYEIPKNIVKHAEAIYNKEELKNSVTKGQRNLSATIAELVVNDLVMGEWIANDSYDYDIIAEGGLTVDVKMRQLKTHRTPNPKWNCGVFDFNTKQKCDAYCFIAIHENFEYLYLHGFIKKEHFYQYATLYDKGEIDPNGNGTWGFPDKTWVLTLEELKAVFYKEGYHLIK